MSRSSATRQARNTVSAGHHQLSAAVPGLLHHVGLEVAQLGTLDASVHAAHQGAADDIAGERQVIAGGEHYRVCRRFHDDAQSKESDIQFGLRQHLTQEIAL